MNKLIWETSSHNPPRWWQTRLGDGLIPISIQLVQSGYCVTLGMGLATKSRTLPTLSQAKFWGVQSADKVLGEMRQELKRESPWLLFVCLVSAIALHAIWIIWYGY
jgi:hypothetical protein